MARHVGPAPSSFERIVVAVDPSGAASKDSDSDEIGIVAAGLRGGEAWVLADVSLRAGPADWGRRAVQLYRDLQADALVAEANFGGAMVDHVMQGAARELRCSVNVKMVTASRGKSVRAEPISAHYAQGRVHHVGILGALEDQLCQFTNSGYKGQGSPDRADAVIWALTELLDAGASVPDTARVMSFGRGTQHRVAI
jgi:phage terminase large subunit-like protein